MLRVRDIMTKDVLTVSPEMSLRDAMELFTSRHISGAPVVAGGKVVGVVAASDLLALAAAMPGVPTERDGASEDEEWDAAEEWMEGDEAPAEYFSDLWADVDAEIPERMSYQGSPEWNALESRTVDEAMTRRVCALRPEMGVRAAADYMRSARIHRVIVMEEGELVGIVSTMDLVDAIADGRLTSQRYTFNADKKFIDR